MFPIEVTWQPASNNASTRRGIWVDTVTYPSKSYTDGTYAHKAIIVDFERNAINIIDVGMVRTLESFIGDEEAPESPPVRPINLYGRNIAIRSPE